MFPLDLKGLTAALDNGSVDLADGAGNVVGVIPPRWPGRRRAAVPSARTRTPPSSPTSWSPAAVPRRCGSARPSWLECPRAGLPRHCGPDVTMPSQGRTYAESDDGVPETGNYSGDEVDTARVATFGRDTYTTSRSWTCPLQHIPGELPHHLGLADDVRLGRPVYRPRHSEAYQVTGASAPSQSMTYPAPPTAPPTRSQPGRRPRPPAITTPRRPTGGGRAGQPGFDPAGVNLLNQWTANVCGLRNYGFAVQTSLANPSQALKIDSYNSTRDYRLAGRRLPGTASPTCG